MAYRKTEKVRAQLEAQKRLIIASAIDLIRKDGLTAMTTRAIAVRAGVASGLVYSYFADAAELLATVELAVTLRDTDLIHTAAKAEGNPVRALAAGVSALFEQHAKNRDSRELAHLPGYRRAIIRELGHLIGAAVGRTDARLSAQAAMGVILAMAQGEDPAAKRLSTALIFVLRGLGLTDASARKAMLEPA